MATNLIFMAGMRGLFMIRVDGKTVIYNDSKAGIQQLYPELSPKAAELFGKHNEKELREYNMCKTEDELVSMVIRDCRLNNCKLIKKEKK